jgi:hypothetical protein
MGFTPEERKSILKQYLASERKTSWPDLDKLTDNQVRREDLLQERLLDEYGKGLPEVPVSRCPFCQDVLKFSFDPMGLDGLWWAWADLVETKPPEEEHYRLLLGAVDFQGRQPTEAEPIGRILPGPGVPFVVPRLLDSLDMIAVISSLTLPHDDVAYLISYFGDQEVDPYHLHQNWARESFNICDEDGDIVAWGAATDPWDFDLEPWIEKGKLKWINPGDESLTMQESGACPYIGLPGTRLPQVIESGVVSHLELPDGEPIDPFE